LKKLEFLSMKPSAIPHSDKDIILVFMKHGNAGAASPGIPKDYLTGDPIPCEMLVYEAEGYSWTSMDVWHFETYNFQRPEDYVEAAKEHYLDHLRQS